MERVHEQILEAQFGPRAQAYVDSAVHARGPDLDAAQAIVEAAAPRHALDIGTGGGHLAYLLARVAPHVTATDLSHDMLAAVAAAARARGLTNIETVPAPAERLPFDDGRFDLVGCRFSAHHWRDVDAGLHEARRVLARGGTAVFIDAVSPAVPLFDTHLQAVEVLRDPSHVRDYSLAEWSAALARAGFSVASTRAFRLRLEFTSWIARMQTPAALAAAIRALQRSAAAETRAYFAIEEDGSFLLDVLLMAAT
jgi:ubiquinone/menaquinone biosynthesis C-methylase UbiE